MPVLSDVQIAQYAYNAGARNSPAAQDLNIAVAIALAESGGDSSATHVNSDAHRSTDLGEWQINNYWQKDLLAKYNWSDPAANAQMMWIIKTTRGGWTNWSTFTGGAFFRFMPRAITAANTVMKGGGTTVPSTAMVPAANMDSGSSGLGKITDSHTWLRLATITAGGILLLVSLAMLGWQGAPQGAKTVAKGVAKTAVKVAVV